MRKKILTLLITLICIPLTISALEPPLRATSEQVRGKLKELDNVLDKRAKYLSLRQQALDSITINLGRHPSDTISAYLRLGKALSSYSTEQSIKYLKLGLELAERHALNDYAMQYRLALSTVFPSNGFIAEALGMFKSVNFDTLPEHLYADYYCAGEKMYETVLEYYMNTDTDTEAYETECSEFRRNAMRYFPPESPEWLLRDAKRYFDGGIHRAAEVTLYDLIQSLDDTHPVYTEAARLMARCNTISGLNHDRMYYLASSAISEIKRGDREGIALHLAGQQLYTYGDINRAHSYLSKAIELVPEAGAQSLRNEALLNTLITIDNSFSSKIDNNIRLLSGLIVMLVLWGILISISLRRHKRIVKQLSRERHLVIEANNAKETFLKNFLELGIVSANRIASFRKLVNRKIASKQYVDLFEAAQSTKILDDQRKQFMTIFDASLLSIYPTFIDEINKLLRPEERYNLNDGHLPSELRVVALVRLGIDDVNRIAEAMSLSVNSIYAYKAKVRNKAINRETFDADLMNIGTIPPITKV
ncbi:MAG: DUF6377 domain-containing protein [Muribaculum sp.]|nr:DUF6377 domain-containing protein [Muribaculum sp.]